MGTLDSLSVKHFAALVAAIAALLTSIGAYWRPEKGAEAGYAELSKSVEELSRSTVQNHDDLVAMKGYLDGLQRAREEGSVVTTAPAPPQDAGTDAGAAMTPALTFAPGPGPAFMRARDASKVSFVIKPVSSAPATPTIAGIPRLYKAPSYDALAK